MKTVVGLFKQPSQANSAYLALKGKGFEAGSLGLLAKTNQEDVLSNHEGQEVKPILGAGMGAVGGAIAGIVLGTLFGGPLGFIGGIVGATAILSGTGAVVGGVYGSQAQVGVSDSLALFVEREMQIGDCLVVVQTVEVPDIQALLKDHGAVEQAIFDQTTEAIAQQLQSVLPSANIGVSNLTQEQARLVAIFEQATSMNQPDGVLANSASLVDRADKLKLADSGILRK